MESLTTGGKIPVFSSRIAISSKHLPSRTLFRRGDAYCATVPPAS
jgi:hypothetical protein